MNFQRPTDADSETLLALTTAFLNELCVGRGGRELRADLSNLFHCESEALATRLGAEAHSGWIAHDATVVGFGFWFNGVGLIFVTPESRHRGTGRGLYKAIRGVHTVVDFWVRPGDRGAKSFGEALGLKARKLVMNESQGADDAE